MQHGRRGSVASRLASLALVAAVAAAVAACDLVPAPDASSGPSAGASTPATPTVAPSPTAGAAGPLASASPDIPPTPTATPRPSRKATARPTQTPRLPSPTPQPSASPASNDFAACPGTVSSGHPVGTATRSISRNWAGYVAASSAGGATCVEATWRQPRVTCPATAFRAVAIWVGIGGYDQGALVQLGTEASCRLGSATYVSWRESLPKERTVVGTGLHVRAGHRIHAQVRWVKGTTYRVSMADLSNGEKYSTTVSNRTVKRTSAEWVVEAPATACTSSCRILSMPRFSTVTFSNVGVTWHGVRQSLDGPAFVHDRVRMVTSGGSTRAEVTSTAASGKSFKVAWRRP